MKTPGCLLLFALMLTGCDTTRPGVERGPDGTIAYKVPVDANEPGARIEVNGESVGNAPLVLKIFGDRDGTFHSFGAYEFIVRAYPPGNGAPVTKVYRTGALFAPDDKVPEKIYFDF